MYFSKIHGSYPAYRIPRVNAPSPFSTSRVVRTEHIPEATPQASKSGAGIQDADTLPATDSQLEESKASSKAPSSPVNSIGSMASSARTPSDTSVAVSQLIFPLFRFYSHPSLSDFLFEFTGTYRTSTV